MIKAGSVGWRLHHVVVMEYRHRTIRCYRPKTSTISTVSETTTASRTYEPWKHDLSPPGMRIADKLEWARDFIAQYEGTPVPMPVA